MNALSEHYAGKECPGDPDVNGWFPIETAPNEKWVLVCRPPTDGPREVGEDIRREYNGRYQWGYSRRDAQPTHWQPMPNPAARL